MGLCHAQLITMIKLYFYVYLDNLRNSLFRHHVVQWSYSGAIYHSDKSLLLSVFRTFTIR